MFKFDSITSGISFFRLIIYGNDVHVPSDYEFDYKCPIMI